LIVDGAYARQLISDLDLELLLGKLAASYKKGVLNFGDRKYYFQGDQELDEGELKYVEQAGFQVVKPTVSCVHCERCQRQFIAAGLIDMEILLKLESQPEHIKFVFLFCADGRYVEALAGVKSRKRVIGIGRKGTNPTLQDKCHFYWDLEQTVCMQLSRRQEGKEDGLVIAEGCYDLAGDEEYLEISANQKYVIVEQIDSDWFKGYRLGDPTQTVKYIASNFVKLVNAKEARHESRTQEQATGGETPQRLVKLKDMRRRASSNADELYGVGGREYMAYSYEAIMRGDLPEDADWANVEKHLNKSEFEKVFMFDYQTFCEFPNWKQQNMRREKLSF